ncbi:hypothetical protein HDV00_002055 [Rhizophlyctis rosea]|nr:hypothetical protein HDV00_002055 [Rhizophlyctis rosea]
MAPVIDLRNVFTKTVDYPELPINPTTGSYLQVYIQSLKLANKPLKEDQLRRTPKNHNTVAPPLPAVWDSLKNNDKVIYDAVRRTYMYKPQHAIKSKDALLEFLKQNRAKHIAGQDYRELKESWPEILPAVQELEREGEILVVRTKDNTPKTLFWNDKSLNVAMSDGK